MQYTISQTLAQGIKLLGAHDSKLDVELLLAHVLGVSRLTILTEPSQAVPAETFESFCELLERRKRDEPLALLVGHKEFYGREYIVTEDTLVPRPETEWIVEYALSHLPEHRPLRVLDLGTGSGCLAITLALELSARGISHTVLASDISGPTLSIATKNASKLQAQVTFVQSDWWQTLPAQKFDLIVTNPPYIADNDPEVGAEIAFEPAAALYSGPDGLDAYRVILSKLNTYLAPGGVFIGEHGRDQRPTLKAIAPKDAQFFDDLAKRERFLVVTTQL